jgi:hypothetical protein
MQHIIQYHTFDVAFSDAGKSYDLQNKISDIFNNQLIAGMERLFDSLVPQDTTLTLSEVNIDVGTITYNLLEYNLADRVLAELEKEIRYRLSLTQNTPAGAETQDEFKSLKASYTNLLEYFLLTGAMPWWATGQLLVDPAKVMEHLLSVDAAGLKQLIINVGQQAYVRQRLVHQFSTEVIRSIITLLEPAEATFIFDYHATAVKVHHEEKLVENAPGQEFDKALWVFILTYILVDRGSLFNQKSFVKATLALMSSHFNRSYTELLTLLSNTLNNDKLLVEKSGYLPVIIEELFAEEIQNKYPTHDSKSNNSFDNDAGIVQNIELLKHYLVFGTLPWWAEPYAAGYIIDLFLGLIKTAPKILSKLITTIGQNEEVRKRIATVFEDEVIIAVVKLLEPANAAFIINYVAEVQQLHVKKVVVNADSKEFKKAVWKFVIDFLIVERGSVFNQRMFLQSNIRMLANNYNVQYSDMLSFFVQSISQLHQDSMIHAPLFKLLAGLLHDVGQQTLETEPQVNTLKRSADKHKIKKAAQSQRIVVLKDVLLHWLMYGNIPWWGKDYFNRSPVSIMEELLLSAPQDTELLLKYASTDINMQKRVIYQLSAELIVTIFKLYPQGEEAVKLYGFLLKALASSQYNKHPDKVKTEKLLLLILWNTFIDGGYETFNIDAFFSSAIHYLSEQYHSPTAAILDALKNALSASDKKLYEKRLNNLSQKSFGTSNELTVLDEEIVDINELINNYLTGKHIPRSQAIFKEALQILEYFWTHNKLPQQFKGTNPAYINAIVKQLLLFLNSVNKAVLKQKLKAAGKSDLYLLIESDEVKAQIDGGIEQMITRYLFDDKPLKEVNVIKEALRILEYFLANGKMPEYLANTNTQYILKQLLVLLNYEDPSALNNLLQKDNHTAAARMQLHNVFAVAENTAENNVARVLKSYFEKDALLYIKQTPGISLSSDDKLIDLITPYLQKPQSHATFIMAILKQASMATYIASNYNNELVYSLLSANSNVIGGTENLVWLKQLHQLFDLSITDTLMRDQFAALFREFNLLLLGGYFVAKTKTGYLKAFFRFISSVNHSLFLKLSNQLLDPEPLPAIALAMPEVLLELQNHEESESAKLKVQKLLLKTDQLALKEIAPAEADGKPPRETNQQPEDEIDKNKDALVNNKDTVYINNAGLVLLNPFLATYFVRLGMMEQGKFINVDAQLRAVHLLQYLVNGEQESAEHELVLNKILCNVPVQEAVPLGITLTDTEKIISGELLKALLNSWDKLKNTSISAFQSSFLQRSGALAFTDDAWHLRVEQRGYDVLLQTLPWTIGMIKTPWMDNFLYVEWT